MKLDTLNHEEIDLIARAICGEKRKLSSKLKKIQISFTPLVFPILRAAGIQTKLNKKNRRDLLERKTTQLLIKRVSKIASSFI